MKKTLTAFVLATALASSVSAEVLHGVSHEIPVMNWDAYIEQSNVLVGAGGEDFCSGTVISKSKRLILTAYHCVEMRVGREEVETVDPVTGEITTKTIQKKLDLEVAMKTTKNYEVVSQRRFTAKIKGTNKDGDVALLQVTDESWAPPMEAKLAPDDYEIKRGQAVFVIGNPGVILDNSITQGIVSAPERSIDFGGGKKINLFQVDAASTGGNSGGQVVNENGEMIGTLTGGLRGVSINFVVPISVTKTLLRTSGFKELVSPAPTATTTSTNRTDNR